MKYYTGIGSRETPQDILQLFEIVGEFLAKKCFVLRSGGAKGADKAFEKGCNKVNGNKEIYLPWEGFENSTSTLIVNNPKAFEIAEEFHPYWHNLTQGARKLQARNSHQILGKDLDTLPQFIICWTKNSSGKGGTGQALRIANHYNIPVFDAGKYKDIDTVKSELKLFLQEQLNKKYTLYTTYLSKLKNIPENALKLIITRFPPKYLNLNEYPNTYIVKQLAPSIQLLTQYKKNNNWEWYVKEFQLEMQTRKDMIKAINRLKEILDDEEDVYLICYEKDYTKCHRNLIARKLQQEGYNCKELKM